jgi:hypothetical protein
MSDTGLLIDQTWTLSIRAVFRFQIAGDRATSRLQVGYREIDLASIAWRTIGGAAVSHAASRNPAAGGNICVVRVDADRMLRSVSSAMAAVCHRCRRTNADSSDC